MSNVDSCPWDGFSPSTYHFCEERLCAWITEPANAWSSAMYVLVGLLIIYLSIRKDSRAVQLIGYMAILVGVASFFYHASSILVAEIFDLFSMYLFSTYALVVNCYRLYQWNLKRLIGLYVGVILASLALLLWMPVLGILIFAFQVIAVMVLELKLYRRQTSEHPINYRPIVWMITFFAIALGIWILSWTGIVCDPYNHWLQGHAIWHVLNSFCFYFLYQFYRQFD